MRSSAAVSNVRGPWWTPSSPISRATSPVAASITIALVEATGSSTTSQVPPDVTATARSLDAATATGIASRQVRPQQSTCRNRHRPAASRSVIQRPSASSPAASETYHPGSPFAGVSRCKVAASYRSNVSSARTQITVVPATSFLGGREPGSTPRSRTASGACWSSSRVPGRSHTGRPRGSTAGSAPASAAPAPGRGSMRSLFGTTRRSPSSSRCSGTPAAHCAAVLKS